MAREVGGNDSHAEARDIALGLIVVCGRAGATAGRFALLPLRLVARSPVVGPRLGRTGESLAEEGRDARVRGRDQLETAAGEVLSSPEVESAVDQALAGPLPEVLARSVVDHRVVQRVADQVLASTDLEAAVAAALENETTERLVEQTLASPGFERLLTEAVESRVASELVEEIASSPAVRAALARQTTTLGEELAAALRGFVMRLDNTAERTVHGWLRRSVQPASADAAREYGGLSARGTAFGIDLVITHVVFLIGAAVVGLVATLVGGFRPSWLAQALAAAGWALVVGGYFVLLWTVAGQTLGMRVMHLRVDRGGHSPRLGWSLVRLIGVVLAIVPMFAGFVPVLIDGRRRALQDFLAGTVVSVDPAEAAPQR